MKLRTQDDMKIVEDAARWLVRLEEDPSAECQAEFTAWLKHSPRHLEELMLADAAYAGLEGIDLERRIDVHELLKDGGAEVVPLQSKAPHVPLHSFAFPTYTRWTIAALVCICTAAALLWIRPWSTGPDSYRTAVGEQRSLRLDDGSVIYLNTQSQVELRFSPQGRDAYLLSGEALFSVAKDPARPFRVHSGSAVIQALGTQFNVYKGNSDTTVSVIEGSVRVSAQHGAPATMQPVLTAGEQANVPAGGENVKRSSADIQKAIAWRQRQLVFSANSLEEVVRQVNRYNRTQLAIADPEIAARRLSGVFNVDDLDSLLLFLNGDGDLTFDYEAGGGKITIEHRKR